MHWDIWKCWFLVNHTFASVSLFLSPFLFVRACVRACACRLPTALTLLQLTEAHRDAAPTRFSSGSAPVPSVLPVLTPRCIRGASPASFHQFPPLLWFFSCRRSGAGYGAVCDRSSGISVNMAFIGDADPFTAAIPATKVELTVSCRWVQQYCH